MVRQEADDVVDECPHDALTTLAAELELHTNDYEEGRETAFAIAAEL